MPALAPYPCHECGGEMWAPYKSKFIGPDARKYCSRRCTHAAVGRSRRFDADQIESGFFDRVEPEPMSGCWLWTGELIWSGYGHGHLIGLAHRYSWERVHGPVPTGLVLDHKCRVRSCVNPDHLRAVTQRVNVLFNSMSLPAQNLAKSQCKRGHQYDGLRIGRNGRQHRMCSVCANATARESQRARRRRRRANALDT